MSDRKNNAVYIHHTNTDKNRKREAHHRYRPALQKEVWKRTISPTRSSVYIDLKNSKEYGVSSMSIEAERKEEDKRSFRGVHTPPCLNEYGEKRPTRGRLHALYIHLNKKNSLNKYEKWKRKKNKQKR